MIYAPEKFNVYADTKLASNIVAVRGSGVGGDIVQSVYVKLMDNATM